MSLHDISRWIALNPSGIDTRVITYLICIIACFAVYLIWKR